MPLGNLLQNLHDCLIVMIVLLFFTLLHDRHDRSRSGGTACVFGFQPVKIELEASQIRKLMPFEKFTEFHPTIFYFLMEDLFSFFSFSCISGLSFSFQTKKFFKIITGALPSATLKKIVGLF